MASKRPLPFILPASLDERRRSRELRRHKIKPANIARIYEGDGWVLYIPTKKSYFKLPKVMIPSRELEHRIKTIHAYIEEYKGLIDVERRAEMDAQIREIRSISGKEREVYGRAILGLRGRSVGRKFDLYLYRFSRDRIIETEIGSGDIVLISRGDPLKSDLTATVMHVAKNFVEVAFSQKPPPWVKEGVRLDLFVNDVTFKRMENNLERIRHIESPFSQLRDIVLGLAVAKPAKIVSFDSQNERLNEKQHVAVAKALGAKEIALIHGPPGTGKTTAVVEAVVQFVKAGKKVLAAADSNVAVDNMLEKLAEKEGIDLVRIGHPARVGEKLEKYALFSRIEADPRTQKVKAMLEDAQKLVEVRNRYSKPTQARLRGMSKERVKTLAATGRAYRGVDVKTIQSMAQWIKEDEKVERFYAAIRELETSIIRDIIGGADVVLSTNGMIGAEMLEGFTFDVAVIDEASQQMEPSTLLPMMRAKKVVLAGDHKQLPPTVISNLDILKHSLFERLMERSDTPQTMLEVQYRMNEKIMEFPNLLMYAGKLKADESVAHRKLRLEEVPESRLLAEMFAPDVPLLFADTVDLDADEVLQPRATSYENPVEAEWVMNAVKALLEGGVEADEIGIITPYLAQVKRIRQMLETEGLKVEVKSVDGFQGREKEAIVISFVRANIAKEIGFVKDRRRLNVAMTRAKTKLIMIGNRPTLEAHDPFDRLFDWLKTQKGASIRLFND
ncbi:IGHMBP2 family helicase [Hydrogenimonas cancrithermarum]|uniref:AAA family ATPase n=1 Tax=Hydrogenimonas cancrithermarum TaxID=2993563 RepID=A0ABM8FJI2_9BACT|nr:IGHMBP2 family helicase [Hydrogenimonas cancrithermarum]BDY12443.1 AAA family ATPase [Hydrogenimonas cancrithermarum]